jgi:hypothetical protein
VGIFWKYLREKEPAVEDTSVIVEESPLPSEEELPTILHPKVFPRQADVLK